MIIYLLWFFASVLVFIGTLKSDRKTQHTAVTLFLIALGIFVGLGDMLGGYDRYIYAELFDNMADWNNMGGNPWLSPSFLFYGSEFGYGTFCALLTYVTANRYIFIFVLTIVTYVLLIRSLRDYVDNAPFAVVVFMALWFFFTFTYLRQVIGCTIVWLSVKYIINRDLKRFLLVVFLGLSFHNSAIVFLPMYFVPVRKFPVRIVMYIMIGALFIGLSPLPQALFSAYGNIDADRANLNTYEMDAGFRWAYLLEAVFFLYVIFKNYNVISTKSKDVVMLNLALVFCAILLIFVRSENGGRLGWLFMIGVMCTMSNLCVKGKVLRKQGVMILAVSFFLFFRILNLWSFNMCPYKTFLTPGHMATEWIHQEYEYDYHYDINKFYR